jgi:hypothetical protein
MNAATSIVRKLEDATADSGSVLRSARDGKVGIGLSCPTSTLHVHGDVRIEDDLKVRNHVCTSRGLRISSDAVADGVADRAATVAQSRFAYESAETVLRLDALAAAIAWCSNAIASLAASSDGATLADVRKAQSDAKRYAKGQVESLSNWVSAECLRVAVEEAQKATAELREASLSAEEADVMYVRKGVLSLYPTIAQANATFLRKTAAAGMFGTRGGGGGGA